MATNEPDKGNAHFDAPPEFNSYFVIAILSVILAVAGFTYNTWRLESTEANSNIRMASFTILTKLAELEQVIYHRHYDQDLTEGNPRKGWIMVGLVSDLSVLVNKRVIDRSDTLKLVWSQNWEKIPNDRAAVNTLVNHIENVRTEIKTSLSELR